MLASFRLWTSLAGAAVVLALLTWSHVQAYQRGAASERQAILTRSVEVLRERNRIDDQARNMDSAELCRALGGQWVQDHDDCQ